MKAAADPAANGWRSARRQLSAADPVMANVIAAVGPCTLVPQFSGTPFSHLIHAIAHQQLNGTAAKTILARFLALYPGATHPAPGQILATDPQRLRAAGLSRGKIEAIRDLAEKTLDGIVPLDSSHLLSLENDAIITRLTQVRGIGPWTVQMMLMFQLGRRDVLPVDDFGVRSGFMLAYGLRSMPHPGALADFGQRWSPWRSIASWYLWRAVDLHRANKLPAAPKPPPRIRKPARRRSVRRKT